MPSFLAASRRFESTCAVALLLSSAFACSSSSSEDTGQGLAGASNPGGASASSGTGPGAGTSNNTAGSLSTGGDVGAAGSGAVAGTGGALVDGGPGFSDAAPSFELSQPSCGAVELSPDGHSAHFTPAATGVSSFEFTVHGSDKTVLTLQVAVLVQP